MKLANFSKYFVIFNLINFVTNSYNISSSDKNVASLQLERLETIERRVFVRVGKIFIYKLISNNCALLDKNITSGKWLYFNKDFTMLVGIPIRLESRRVSFLCDNKTRKITVQLVVKSSPLFNANFFVRIYTQKVLSLMKKLQIVTVFESNTRSYQVFENDTNNYKPFKLLGKPTNVFLDIAININVCHLQKFIANICSLDYLDIFGLELFLRQNLRNQFLNCPRGFFKNITNQDSIRETRIEKLNGKRRLSKRSASFAELQLPNQNCRNNVAPLARQANITFEILAHRLVTAAFDENLFIDREDGNLKLLQLHISWENKKEISTKDWLFFNKPFQAVLAFATEDVYKSQPAHGYKLIAQVTDRCNASTYSDIFLKIRPVTNQTMCNYVSLLIERNIGEETSYVYILNEIFLLLTQFFSKEPGYFIVKKFSGVSDLSLQVFSLVLTINPQFCFSCKKDLITMVKNFEQKFKRFATTVYKYKYSILSDCNNNSRPLILYKLDTFNLSSLRSTAFKIPSFTVYDYEDGFTNSMELRKQTVNETIDVISIMINQTVYAYQLKTSNKEIVTRLELKDSSNNILPIFLKIRPSEYLIPVENWFNVTLNAFFDHKSRKEDILYELLTSLSIFFHIENKIDDFVIIDFRKKGIYPLTCELVFSLKFLLNETKENIAELKMKMFNSDATATTLMATALLPYFRNIFVYYFTSQTSLDLTVHEGPDIHRKIPTLFVTTSDIFRYKIPSDVFIDKFDGDASHLDLNLLYMNGSHISMHSLIQFDSIKQEIYSIITTEMMEFSTEKVFKFTLKACNSRIKCTNITVFIQARRNPIYIGGIKVEIIMEYPWSSTKNDLQILIFFLNKYFLFTRNTQLIEVESFKNNRLFTLNLIYNFTSFQGACLKNSQRTLKKKLLDDDDNRKIKMVLSSQLLPDFILKTISVRDFGKCVKQSIIKSSPVNFLVTPSTTTRTLPVYLLKALNRPTLKHYFKRLRVEIEIPRIYVSFCKPLYYYVHPGTFMDEQDGNLRNLTVELLHKTGEKVNSSSWIQWNQALQCVFGLFQLKDYNRLAYHDTHQYMLQATNSDGYSVSTPLQLIFPISKLQHNYKISLVINAGFFPDRLIVNEQISLWTKLSSFFNTRKLQVISYNQISLSRASINWFLCGLDGDKCEKDEIMEIKYKIFDRNDNPKSSFIKALRPIYDIIEARFTFLSLCQSKIAEPLKKIFPSTPMTISVSFSKYSASSIYTSQSKPNVSLVQFSSIVPTSKFSTFINFPPMILKAIPEMEIDPCKPFYYKLPEDAFFDIEDGLTRNLQIKIYSMESKKPVYLKFNVTSQIFSAVWSENFPAKYNIVATDKAGKSVSQSVSTHLMHHDKASYFHIILNGYRINQTVSIMDTKFLISSKIDEYFSNNVQGIKLNVTSKIGPLNTIVINLSSCNVPCVYENYNQLKSMFFTTEETLRESIISLFLPFVVVTQSTFQVTKECAFEIQKKHPTMSMIQTYISTEVSTKTTGSQLLNTPPEIKNPLPLLKATSCKHFEYKIPEDTCYDDTDGFTSNLRVKLLMLDFKSPPQNYWLRLNPVTNTLYGFIKDISDKKNVFLSYLLNCTDTDGASVSQQFHIMVNQLNYPPNHLITFHSYLHMTEGDSEVKSRIVNKIARYVGDVSTDMIHVYSYSRTSGETLYVDTPQITISWYNCSISNPCNNTELNRKFFDGLNFNSEFTLAMIPEFVLIGGLLNRSTCDFATTISPTLSFNRQPEVKTPLDDINVPICSTFSFRIPDDTFSDFEDGNSSRNLKLALLDENLKYLTKTSWVQFVESTQVIYGHVSASQLSSFSKKKIYYIKATDIGKKSVYTKLNLILPANPAVAFHINMTLTRYFDFNTTDLITQIFLTSQLSLYMGDKDVSNMLIQSFLRTRSSIYLSWTNCSFVNNPCNRKAVDYIKMKLIKNGNPTPTLISEMAPYYSIDSLNIYHDCFQSTSTIPTISITPSQSTKLKTFLTPSPTPMLRNLPPRITRYIPPLTIKKCEKFQYNIPEEIFLDEDGTTSALKLELLEMDMEKVSNNSWILILISRPILYGMVKLSDISQNGGRFRYHLKAVDSKGLFSTIPIFFNNVDEEELPVYYLKAKFLIISPRKTTNMLIVIIQKFNRYLKLSNDIFAISFNKLNSVPVTYSLTLSFCSFIHSSCPTGRINNINSKVFTSSGVINENLKNVFSPDGFRLLDITAHYTYPCLPITPTNSAPSTTLPVIQLTALTINMSLYDTVNRKIPVKYFSSPSEVTVASYSLTYENGSIVSCQSWLQVNRSTNTIYGVIRSKEKNLMRKFLLKLIYEDDSVAVASVNINIESTNNAGYLNLYFVFKTNLNLSVCEAHILKLFKTKLKLHLKNISFQILHAKQIHDNYYLKISVYADMPDKCNYDQVLEITSLLFANHNKKVSKDLKDSLLPEFYDLSVLDEILGPCSSNLTIIPNTEFNRTVCVVPCETFNQKIPINLFVDTNMNYETSYIIEVTHSNRSSLTDQSWIRFDEKKMVIYGIPAARLFSDTTTLLVTAFSYNGYVTTLTLIFDICQTAPQYNEIIEIELECDKPIGDSYAKILFTLQQLSEIFSNGKSESLYIIEYSIDINILRLTFSSCLNEALSMKNIIGNIIDGCVIRKSILTDTKDYPPIASISDIRYKPRFCQHNHYEIPFNTFMDREDGDIRSLILYLTFINGTKTPKNFWAILSDNKITILLSSQLENNRVYEFRLNAQDSNGVVTFIPLYIDIFNEFKNFNFFIFLQYKPLNSLPMILQINDMFEKMNRFLGTTAAYAVQRFQAIDESRTHVEFANCSLSVKTCDFKSLEKITNKLKSNADSNINPDFVTYMFPECYIEHLTLIKTDLCDFKDNTPPLLIHPIADVIVPIHGYLKYQIPKNTFYDEEDGWTRNLTLSIDSIISCWLEMNTSSQTIYALISEDILKAHHNYKIILTLTATDSAKTGKTNTTINLVLPVLPRTSFMIAILFQITYIRENTCMHEKLDILNRLNKYTNMSLTIRSAHKGADNLFIEVNFADSLMRYNPCDYIAADRFISLFQEKNENFKDRFVKSMEPEYTPRYISTHKEKPCFDSSNKPPKQVNKLNFTNISTSYSYHEIPADIVYDEEDGGIFNMKVSLIDAMTGFKVSKSDWIFLNDTSNVLVLVGNREIEKNQPRNGYQFMLEVEDSRKAKTIVGFNITFKPMIRKETFTISEISKQKVTENPVLSIFKWKRKQEEFLGFSIELIKYRFYTTYEVICNITWTKYQESDICDFEALRKIEYIYKLTVDVANFFVNKFDACLDEPMFPPKPKHKISIYLDPCKEINYTLPDDTFVDDKDGGTPNLTIYATLISPSSNIVGIKYDFLTQTFSGFAIIDYFLNNNFIEFYLEAVDSDRMTSNTTLRFFLKKSETSRHLEISAKFFYYTSVKTTNEFFEIFKRKLSKYLNLEKDSIIIYNYNSTTGPICDYYVSFGFCNSFNCANNSKEQISALLMEKQNEPTMSFLKAMLNSIVPSYISITKNETCLDASPTTGKLIGTININMCTEFKYEIPENAFFDNEDGNSRNMSLSLDQNNFDWIYFNSTFQTINGILTIKEYLLQPTDGYKISITAIDSSGNKVSQTIYLKISDIFVNYVLKLSLEYTGQLVLERNELLQILQTKIASITKVSFQNIRVYRLSSYIVHPNDQIYLEIFNCDLEICSPEANKRLFVLLSNLNGKAKARTKNFFANLFHVNDIVEIHLNKCKEAPYTTSQIPNLFFRWNKMLEYFLPKNLFMDSKDGVLTGKFIVLLTNSGNRVPKWYPVSFDGTRIYGFITYEESLKFKNGLKLILRVRDTDGEIADASVNVSIPQELSNPQYLTTASMYSYINQATSDIDILLNILRDMYIYFGDTENNTVIVINFKRDGDNIPQVLTIQWVNVTLIGKCNQYAISNIQRRIFNSENQLNIEYIKSFDKRIIHKKTVSIRENECLTNESPQSNKNLTITFRSRSFHILKLEDDMFTDKEDGKNLSKKILFKNFTAIPLDYWLQFDNKDNILFGFPDNKAVELGRETFFIQATDSGNKSALSIIEIKFVISEANDSIEVDIVTFCKNFKNTIISRIIELTKTIAIFLNIPVDNIALKKYNDQGIQVFFTLSIHSTVNLSNISDLYYKEIVECILVRINNTKTTVTTKTTVVAKTTVVTKEVPSTANSVPVLVNSIPDIIVECGVPKSYKIPENTFYDKIGSAELVLTLLDSKFALMESPSLIELNKGIISIFYSVNQCSNTYPQEIFGIKATNKNGGFVIDTFHVIKNYKTLQCCDEIQFVFTPSIYSFENISSIYKALTKDIYRNQKNNIVIKEVSILHNSTVIIYANNSFTNNSCYENETEYFSSAVFDAVEPAKLKEELFNAFPSIINASIMKCNATTQLVPITFLIAPTAGKFITAEEWFFYILPLFLLAFMLLMSCLCFYFCRYFYRKCCTSIKPTKITVIPEEEIMPNEPIQSLYAAIPIQPISPVSVRAFNANEDNASLPQSWDIPDKGSSFIIPTHIQENEKELSFHTSLLSSPEELSKPIVKYRKQSRPERRESLNLINQPVSVTYAKPSHKRPEKFGKLSQNIDPKRKRQLSYIVPTRGPLRLPAIPSGPPPPYSPPRRQRAFSQNVIPNYYEKYIPRRSAHSSFLIPVHETLQQSPNLLNPIFKTKKVHLPHLKRLKRKNTHVKRYSPLLVDIPEIGFDSQSPRSDDSIEVDAVLRGKPRSVRKILKRNSKYMYSNKLKFGKNKKYYKHRSPKESGYVKDIGSSRVKTASIPRENFNNKSRHLEKNTSRSLPYDYLPVRENKRNYRLDDPTYLEKYLKKSTGSYGYRNSRYLDALTDKTKINYEDSDEHRKKRKKKKAVNVPLRGVYNRDDFDDIVEESL